MSQVRRLKPFKRGLEFGFFEGEPIIYDGVEPTAIDAQMGKGKFTRFLGVNLVSPRTDHFSKIITDVKDGELAWATWKTLERQGYTVRFMNTSQLYGYPTESYNPNTRLLEVAGDLLLHLLVGESAYDAASFLIPIDPNPNSRWIGQGVRTMLATYYTVTALMPSGIWPCTPGGAWDFLGRQPQEVADSLLLWAEDDSLGNYAGICKTVAGWATSPDQWNAYASVIVERLQMFQRGSAARSATDTNSFDPAELKQNRTAIFMMGSARSESSRNFVGAMTAAMVERIADAHGDLRTLIVGDEWGQFYVSNFYEILTLFRDAGINFVGAFQNVAAQVEAKYGKEVLRIWKKAAAMTLYRGFPDTETAQELGVLGGTASVMVRGFSVNNNQVNGSGDTLGEQARPLLQVENLRALTGGETGLLHARDYGFFSVDTPNFWERPELNGYIRDTRTRPDRYAHLKNSRQLIEAPTTSRDAEIEAVLNRLRGTS